jgi:putative glycosyltransferase (TIGR04372 family)
MKYKSFWSKRFIKSTNDHETKVWEGIIEIPHFIKSWGYFIPGVIAVIPLVLIIRVIRPFILFRFGNLNSLRIGHFVFDVDYYLSEKELGLHPKRSVDLFSFGRTPCNEQFAIFCERKLLMSFNWFIKDQIHSIYRYLWMCNQIIPFGSAHTVKVATIINHSRDVNGYLSKTKPHFSFNEIENNRANNFLSEIGFKNGDKFVCYIIRDSEYLSNKDYSCHDYRNSDSDTYNESALYLAEKGYWVMRMGKKVSKPFTADHPRILDYASSPYRSDFLDIWLMAHCHFCVTTGTGIDDVSIAFRLPIVNVNYLPIGSNRCNLGLCVDLNKYLRWKTNGKFLSLNDQIKTGAIYFQHLSSYEDLGVEVVDNTAEEILNSVIEMEERLNGTWIEEPEDIELQRIFFEKIKTWPDFEEITGWISPDARISASFLRKNHGWFLS